MMRSTNLFSMMAVLVVLTGCGAAKTVNPAAKVSSVLVATDYKADKDVTYYTVHPYGQVSIPGKWEKGNYLQSSQQQFFLGPDSTIIALALTSSKKFGFNREGKMKGIDFAKAFYEWDSDYFVEQGFERQLIETNEAGNYVLYRIYGEKANNYFLIREKNGTVSNFSVQSAPKWSEEKSVKFLKSLL